MKKYQLRLKLRNENGGSNTRGKWHIIFESDESNKKGEYLNLAYGNERLSVFEYDDENKRYIEIERTFK